MAATRGEPATVLHRDQVAQHRLRLSVRPDQPDLVEMALRQVGHRFHPRPAVQMRQRRPVERRREQPIPAQKRPLLAPG
jgi:hypothetical protein